MRQHSTTWTRRPRSAFRLFALVATLALLAGCTHHKTSPSSVTDSPPGPSTSQGGAPGELPDDVSFGYTSDEDLGFVRNGEVVATVRSKFFHILPPQFTSDGKYLFAAAGDDQLGIIDVKTLKARTVSAPGSTGKVVPNGGSSVTWLQGVDQLLTMDLGAADPSPSPGAQVHFPEADVSGAESPNDVLQPRLVGSNGKALLFARLDHKAGTCLGPDNLYLLQNDTVSSFGKASGCTPITKAVFSNDGRRLAYANETRMCEQASVTVRDTNSPATQTLTIDASQRDTRSTIPRLWWDANDALNIGYASWHCGDSGLTPVEPPTVWTNTDNDWKQSEPTPVLQILSFPSGSTAILTPTASSTDAVAKGDLWIGTGQNRRHVAGNVTDLTALAMPNGM